MAVTKLLRLKEAKGAKKSAHLENNLKYILNPEKTQGGINIGGNAGIDAKGIYDAMMENKRFWGKEDGSQGFHYVLSFSPDEDVSMDLAYEVAGEFCRRLLGDAFLYAYAIHDDKAHLHIHLTFDSVSRVDGHKYHSPRGDWEKKIQPITDGICREYGLKTLTYGAERTGTSYSEWQKAGAGSQNKQTGQDRYSWNDIIRDDVDEALRFAGSYDAFLALLKKMHYQIRDGKYLSLKPYGKAKAVRTRSLGAGYGKEEILLRIADHLTHTPERGSFKTYGDQEAIRLILVTKRRRIKGWHLSPFQRIYYIRWNNTCLVRRPGFSDAWKYKKDVARLKEISDHLKYLLDHDITSLEDLTARGTALETERKAANASFMAAKSRFYQNKVCKLVRQRRKMEGRTEDAEPSKKSHALEENLAAIQQIMHLSEAEAYFDQCSAAYRESRMRLRGIEREMKQIAGIEAAYEETLQQARSLTYDETIMPTAQTEPEQNVAEQAEITPAPKQEGRIL